MNRISQNRRGLTLIEILTAIGIVLILATLVLVMMRPAQSLAQQTRTLSALRQMGAAFSAYSGEHRQRYMPGFLGGTHVQDFNPRLPHGAFVAEYNIDGARSYVWRLAPYVDNEWQTFYVDARGDTMVQSVAHEFMPSQGEVDPVVVAMNPTIGMNSIYVGGDSRHGGDSVRNRNPWDGADVPLAATRVTEVRNPANLLVFGPAAPVDPDPNGSTYVRVDRGYPELRPPWVVDRQCDVIAGSQWRVDAAGIQRGPNGQYVDGAGLPILRFGGSNFPMALADGSTDTMDIAALSATTEQGGTLLPNENFSVWTPWRWPCNQND